MKKHQNHPAPQPKKNSSEKESTNRHVYIEPGVKIDLVDDLRKQYKTAHDENTAHQKKQLVWTIIAAGLLLVYTFLTGWLVIISRQTFNAANRPYVGISDVQKIRYDATGAVTNNPKVATGMVFMPQIKNFGTTPATNYLARWRIFQNGQEIKEMRTIPQNSATFFPSEASSFRGQIGPPLYEKLMRGELVISFEIIFSYDGPSGHYEYCERRQYDADIDAFAVLGSCRP